MHHFKKHRFINPENIKGVWFHIAGIACLIWFLVRVIPAPHRSQYPCQQIAIPMALTYIAFWSGIWFVLRLWLKKFSSKTSTITPMIVATLFLLVSLSSMSFATNPQPTLYEPWGPIPNQPMGTPQGIHPGRVVWTWNPNATEEHPTGYWWYKENNDQQTIEHMLQTGLEQLTNTTTTTAAWDLLFRDFNQQHGKGDIGYTPGEKIAIKVNLNNQYSAFIDPYIKQDNERDASPYLTKALLKELTHTVGINQTDITIYDASRKMGNWYYNRVYYQDFPTTPLTPEYPNVHYVDKAGEAPGREQAQPSQQLIYFSDGLTRTLPTCVTDADYLINIPILKMHPINHGVTLSGKNYYGTWIEPVVKVHPYHIDGLTMGNPTPQTDLLAHEHIGGKTLLYLGDGLYGTLIDHATIAKFNMYPFNNDWTNSLFLSQDPIAMDSVMYDFLYAEGANPIEGSQNYLHQSAQPQPNTYDPENDGHYLNHSLGVHEHWNTSYSIFSPDRYLGSTHHGIDYQPLGQQYANPAIILTQPKEQHLYIFGEDKKTLRLPITLIIGSIPITAEINGLDQPIETFDILIDNIPQFSTTEPPYSWTWNIPSIRRHTITIKAQPETGEPLQTDLTVWKIL